MIVAEIDKNQGEKFRVTLDRFKGTAVVDLRTFYVAAGGALKPTPKGLSTSVRHLPAIVEALQLALDRAREAGMLHDG
jgi:hypothetical protein